MDVKRNRWIAVFVLIAYGAILIKFVVFKSIPIIHIGHRIFRFGGQQTGPANLEPFKTVRSFLDGRGNHLIAMVNLVGNVIPFMPIGFLTPLIYRRIPWQRSLVLALAVGLLMEGMEVMFRVGIFDIDDVILNAFGVMTGYWIFATFNRRTDLRLP